MAVKTVEAIEGVGVFGIELFLAKDGRLLVNEIAPRTHNSGHYTIVGPRDRPCQVRRSRSAPSPACRSVQPNS
ncbi:MAG: ATP-grasp domain-containing protein [Gammaproteobacteria bacterium]|nr:ATP-grasp domain-containing protein [Gammaproteobacteria bacterium]